jgi:hypothetical protein
MFGCMYYKMNYRKFYYWKHEFDKYKGRNGTQEAYDLANHYGERAIISGEKIGFDVSKIKHDLENIVIEWASGH